MELFLSTIKFWIIDNTGDKYWKYIVFFFGVCPSDGSIKINESKFNVGSFSFGGNEGINSDNWDIM